MSHPSRTYETILIQITTAFSMGLRLGSLTWLLSWQQHTSEDFTRSGVPPLPRDPMRRNSEDHIVIRMLVNSDGRLGCEKLSDTREGRENVRWREEGWWYKVGIKQSCMSQLEVMSPPPPYPCQTQTSRENWQALECRISPTNTKRIHRDGL